MRPYALPALLLLLIYPLAAEESDALSRGPDGETRYFVEGIKVLPLAGRPFSGRSTTEWARTLEDGSVTTTRLYAMVARDGQGRIYREKRRFVPSNSDQQSRLTVVLIFDPLTHTRTECNLAARHSSVTGYHAPTSFTLRPVGPFDDGKRLLARESLGSDVIDGIDVAGTREKTTISAGTGRQPPGFGFHPRILVFARSPGKSGGPSQRPAGGNAGDSRARGFPLRAGPVPVPRSGRLRG
jgi:hypothetical protein